MSKQAKKSDITSVLHLSAFEDIGGAARAAARLNDALGKLKINSCMLVAHKSSCDSANVTEVKSFVSLRLIKYFNSIPLMKYGHAELESDTPFSTSLFGRSVVTSKAFLKADIIQLHWINYGFISLDELHRIAITKKQVVWTLHDMWAMTGGCHNPIICKRYEDECGRCELLGSNIDSDVSRSILQKKKKIVEAMTLTVVVPSTWMKSCAENSSLFRKSRILVIPNTIDCSYFKRISDDAIRRECGFYSSSKYYITFGAHSNASYKGIDYILEALSLIDEKACEREIEVIIFGGLDIYELSLLSEKFMVHNLGQIKDDDILRAIYSMTDIFVSASLQESFGQVLTEAMACETACVAFSNSGALDIISHLENGYLAEYRSTEGLAMGIQYFLNNTKEMEVVKFKSRQKVKETYDYPVVANAYMKLYESLSG